MDYRNLSDGELERLAHDAIDLESRLKAKGELNRRQRDGRSWSRGERWTAAAVIVGVLALAGAFVVPEVRQWVGLETKMLPTTSLSTPVVDHEHSTRTVKGIWVDPRITAQGTQTFYEFLPGGKVRVRYDSISGKGTIADALSWYLTASTLRLVDRSSFRGQKGWVYEGKVSGDIVEGTWKPMGSEVAHPWRLERITDTAIEAKGERTERLNSVNAEAKSPSGTGTTQPAPTQQILAQQAPAQLPAQTAQQASPMKVQTLDEFRADVKTKVAETERLARAQEPACRGDDLKACGDYGLLEWGKPLVERLRKISNSIEFDRKIAAEKYTGGKYLNSMDAIYASAADDFRKCCAADAEHYHKELSLRVGPGKEDEELYRWIDMLLQPEKSKLWKQARNDASGRLTMLPLDLDQLQIQLQEKLDLKAIDLIYNKH